MAITGIDAVTFGVTDMKTALRFCSDWGLVRQNAQTLAAASLPRGSALFHCADGSAVQLVPAQSVRAGYLRKAPGRLTLNSA